MLIEFFSLLIEQLMLYNFMYISVRGIIIYLFIVFYLFLEQFGIVFS